MKLLILPRVAFFKANIDFHVGTGETKNFVPKRSLRHPRWKPGAVLRVKTR